MLILYVLFYPHLFLNELQKSNQIFNKYILLSFTVIFHKTTKSHIDNPHARVYFAIVDLKSSYLIIPQLTPACFVASNIVLSSVTNIDLPQSKA